MGVTKHKIGAKFNMLTLVEKRNNYYWRMLCDCGKEKEIGASKVQMGTVKSCGCQKKRLLAEESTTHGFSYHRFYSIWNTMIQRCTNPKARSFPDYGGRGIMVCERWRKFEGFKEDMFPTWIAGLTIERKDNNLGYNADNCIWATHKEQSRNRRNTILIDTPWGPKTIEELSRLTGYTHGVLRLRRKKFGQEAAYRNCIGGIVNFLGGSDR